MKDSFLTTIKGKVFEFNRVSSTSFDIWYHVSVMVDLKPVLYRMNTAVEGFWKIKTSRLPSFIYTSEADCSEAIEKNEWSVNDN